MMSLKRFGKLIPLCLMSAACLLLSFFVAGDKNAPVIESVQASAAGDLSLSSFDMYGGAQIRMPATSNNTTYEKPSMRFMATVAKEDYEVFEGKYGKGAATDTTEWGIVFAMRSKIDESNGVDLNAATVFGVGGTKLFKWQVPANSEWATDKDSNVSAGSINIFTPVRYDNLDKLSLTGTGEVFNDNLSLEGQAGGAYYVISGAIVVPESHYDTEIVARAYVRYTENGTVKYIFADYAGGSMDNNARSMTYLAQKYVDMDEENGNTLYTDQGVKDYIVSGGNTGYTIEYHFIDPDGRSYKIPVEIDSGAVVDGEIALSTEEIAQMSGNADLIAAMRTYNARIDWDNPMKVEKSKTYANGRTTLKVYYSNSYGASDAGVEYDYLSEMKVTNSVRSWHQATASSAGVTDECYSNYDKTYTLGDDTYRPQVMCDAHTSASECVHTCPYDNCSNPNHGHCSQKLVTEVNSNTLLFNATLWDSSKNSWAWMELDSNGNVTSGLDFSDYDYVLLRFYSSLGGLTMSPIAGVNADGTVKTTDRVYTINQGWNRFEISGEAIQEAIQAYRTDTTYYGASGGLMEDTGTSFAIGSPYRNYQYLQFLVNNGSVAQGTAWTLYVEDIIGVKARTQTTLKDGSFENTNSVTTENLTMSVNTNATYVTAGSKSLKFTDNRGGDTGLWTTIQLPLVTNEGALSLTQLTQMDITFDLYCTAAAILRVASVEWKNGGQSLQAGWNKIHLNGWRIAEDATTYNTGGKAYDEGTGTLRLAITDFASGAVFYIDNAKITPVISGASVSLDEFTWEPTRTGALAKPTILKNEWPRDSSALVDGQTSQSAIVTEPIWYPVEGATSYEVIVNNVDCTNAIMDYTATAGYYMIQAKQGDYVRVRAVRTANGNTDYSEWDTFICASYWTYMSNNGYGGAGGEAPPVVTLSDGGLVTWVNYPGYKYQYQINNAYIGGGTITGTIDGACQYQLQPGQSFSYRAWFKGDGTHSDGAFYSRWSVPVVYLGEDPQLDNTGMSSINTGSSVDFLQVNRVIQNGKSAWKMTMNKATGEFKLPLTIGGQTLTNEQIWAIDYLEITLTAGASNQAGSQIVFNGVTVGTTTVGGSSKIVISGEALYNASKAGKYQNSGGVNATGLAIINITGAKAGDTFIFSDAKIYYR